MAHRDAYAKSGARGGGFRASTSKYGNTKVHRGDEVFDSILEASRYDQLVLLQRAGEIRDLKRQPRFVLQPGFRGRDGKWIRAIEYVGDFSYDTGDTTAATHVVIDVKGLPTKDFLLKAKILRYQMRDRPNFEFRVEGVADIRRRRG